MAIVTSSYVIDRHAQIDGSRWVKESHIDENNIDYPRIYKLEKSMEDKEADLKLANHALYLNEQLIVETLIKTEQENLIQKHAIVLDSAVKSGALSEEEAKKLGLLTDRLDDKTVGVKL